MNEELLIEILKQLMARYNHMNEIYRLTSELCDALSRNDKEAARILLGMRGEEMEAADLRQRNIHLLAEGASGEERATLDRVLLSRPEELTVMSGEPESIQTGWLNKIIDVRKKINKVLKETVETDKIVSRKLAGTDSYYK